MTKHSLSAALFLVFSSVLLVEAQSDQSGFISIDCGLPESVGSYAEPTTGINYVSDEPFINTGVSKTISLDSQAGKEKQLAHLRAFPEGIRNCYTVDVLQGTSYLIRATFYYGNYDGKNNFPRFDLHLGANFWETISFFIDIPVEKEIIHVPLQDYVRVCLATNGSGTPFISVLELRPLVSKTYVTQSGSLALSSRVDLGSITNLVYRYPFDTLDRAWKYLADIGNWNRNWTTISTSSNINPGEYYKTSSVVMSTAIGPAKPNDPLIYSWYTNSKITGYYVYLHFAEVEKLKANESRSFDVFVNGKLYYGPVVPSNLSVFTVFSQSPLPMVTELFGNYTISLVRRKNSTLPPILNAIEIYTSLDLSRWETDKDDVEAVTMVKSSYGVKRNWDGDPCAPITYLWTGLSCSYEGSDPPRITDLNLSSSGLTGDISPSIFNLSMLQSLDLSNNDLTGSIPQFLSKLPNLKVLNLDRNNFTGSIPAELVAKSKNGSLQLSVDNIDGVQNTDSCTSSSCKRNKKSNVLIPIVASVGGLVLLLIAAAAILFGIKSKNKPRKGQEKLPPVLRVTTEADVQSDLFSTKQRQITYSEVVNVTNDFDTILGKGGFGTVYYGTIGDTQVAVKKLSSVTAQGYQQFQAEVKLLMTVHHRNLTSLVGYCIEGTNMALIYEYMTNGDLDSHLLGRGNKSLLSWEERLQIAIDSAQGLEYLHNGCKPPIIHRDVKTTNILLNENLQAKLADFGLSRSFPAEDGTHVFTGVAGTPGYLDPEYSLTNKLTERSDVYSFGVVLLQIITSRSAILVNGDERIHLSQWVSSVLSNGDINGIVDPQLNGDFDTNSAWKAVETAMACVSPKSNKRPNMSVVVSELKECLAAEVSRINYTHTSDWTNSTEASFVNMTSEFGPKAC